MVQGGICYRFWCDHPVSTPAANIFYTKHAWDAFSISAWRGFTDVSCLHSLESGRCTASGLNRHKINHMVHQLDRNNVITRPMITLPGYNNVENIATNRAWNGGAFECYLCTREFNTLNGLNCHIRSPVHEQNLYRCPKVGCGREYKLLSGLVQHVESESCGIMRFGMVQAQARNGIQNMVGRMITG